MLKKVGVIGAGQLAQMLGEAAPPLDLQIVALANDANACAKNTVELVIGNELDRQTVVDFAEQVDVLTFEHEHIKTTIYNNINVPIYPNVQAVRITQNRGLEKNFFKKLGIPTPAYLLANSLSELETAVAQIGYPCVLKTAEGGYDGKGQKFLKQKTDLAAAWNELDAQPLIVEGWLTFAREVSLVAVRAQNGEIAFYPLTENIHRDGILRVSKAPYVPAKLEETRGGAEAVPFGALATKVPQRQDPEHKDLQKLAESYLTKILEELNYVGVLTVEFFQCGDKLVANEMAPRVHNSGHWTIEGAQTSQFSNHLRAVAGQALGSTKPTGFAAMINIIGQWPDQPKMESLRGGAESDSFDATATKVTQRQYPASALYIHDYGKSARVGRKLGHLTIFAPTEKERDEKLQEVLEILKL